MGKNELKTGPRTHSPQRVRAAVKAAALELWADAPVRPTAVVAVGGVGACVAFVGGDAATGGADDDDFVGDVADPSAGDAMGAGALPPLAAAPPAAPPPAGGSSGPSRTSFASALRRAISRYSRSCGGGGGREGVEA